uniref:Beta-2 adrenergic receptor n=1 Tax=Eptatretus burgeri TaxID=7764 RepID=A0A8C4QKL5_EPTBU
IATTNTLPKLPQQTPTTSAFLPHSRLISNDMSWSNQTIVTTVQEPWYTFFTVIFSFFTIITIGGNILVIAALTYSRHLMKGVTNTFICSLACADLLIGLVVMPFTAVQLVEGTWHYGRHVCNFRYSIDVTSVTASINSLFAIAVDRYIAITMPLHYQNRLNQSRAIIFIITIWMASAIISVFPINLGWGRSKTTEAQACFENPKCCSFLATKTYAVASVVLAFYLPAAGMIFVYSRVLKEANRQAQKLNQSGTSFNKTDVKLHTSENGRNVVGISKSERRALKTLSIIMGVFILCWLPFSILQPLQAFCRSCISDKQFYIWIWVGYINSMCNPVLYSRNPEFMALAFVSIYKRNSTKHLVVMPTWTHLAMAGNSLTVFNELLHRTC